MHAYPNPVVFLPGIMGSALRDEYPVAPETVWSTLRLVLNSYDRITLHPDDPRYEVVAPARVVKDQLLELIYTEFIEELRHNLAPQADEPVPVYPFAYDWRRPLADVEQDLAAFVDEAIARTRLLRHYHAAGYGMAAWPAQVNLVGHSMGGLIIAGFLESRGFAQVDRVATIASPFRGSVEAVAKTATGVGALGPAPGSSRERECARITPSLYHLLPSFPGAVTAADGLTPDLFSPAAWQPSVLQSLTSFIRRYGLDQSTPPAAQAPRLLAALLQTAQAHRARLERLVVPAPKSWLCVVGLGRATRVGLGIARRADAPHFDLADATYVRGEGDSTSTATGDNTVPYLGARCSFIPTEQVVGVTVDDFGFWELQDRALLGSGLHAGLPNMNLVQRLVTSHLLERPSGELWGRRAPDLPAAAAWDPPIAGLREARA